MNLDYYLTKRLHMEAGSKFGFYGNHITARNAFERPWAGVCDERRCGHRF